MALVACGGSWNALITIGCFVLAVGSVDRANCHQVLGACWGSPGRANRHKDFGALKILGHANQHKVLGACGGPLGRSNDHRVLDASDHNNHNRVIGDCGGSLDHANNHRALGACCGFLDRTKRPWVLVGDLQPPGRNKFMLWPSKMSITIPPRRLREPLKLIIALTFQNVKNESLELALEGPSDYIIY